MYGNSPNKVMHKYSLGAMYRDGLGVLENDILAEKWTRLSAEQGNRVAA